MKTFVFNEQELQTIVTALQKTIAEISFVPLAIIQNKLNELPVAEPKKNGHK